MCVPHMPPALLVESSGLLRTGDERQIEIQHSLYSVSVDKVTGKVTAKDELGR